MMRRIRYIKGDVIIVEGSHTSEVYFLRRGSAEVYRQGPPEVRLAVLRPGDVFGEMALITEQPRSASVRALEDVEVDVIDRDEFLDLWRADPEMSLRLIRMLCERVRALNALVTELSQHAPNREEAVRAHCGNDADSLHASAPLAVGELHVVIEGLTPRASQGLGAPPISIDCFPYRIGRLTDDPLSDNDLKIPDREPFHVSRNHCMIVCVDTRCFLIDCGSRLGTIVNGIVVGAGTDTTRVELRAGDNEVVLGSSPSPYRYRVAVVRP